MSDYMLFLDEAEVTATNPYFCLAGIIVKRDVYENCMIPTINELKKKHFGNTSVIFHYTDMKKNKAEFSKLQDSSFRSEFWRDFNSEISKIDFQTMGVYFEKKKFQKTYGVKGNRHYEFAFRKLMNNYICFLKMNNNSRGCIIVESRQWQENSELQEVHNKILQYGTDIYLENECKKILSTIGFHIKKDNCVGLQLADFVPDVFMRKVNNQSNYNNVGVNFLNKRVTIDGSSEFLGMNKIM